MTKRRLLELLSPLKDNDQILLEEWAFNEYLAEIKQLEPVFVGHEMRGNDGEILYYKVEYGDEGKAAFKLVTTASSE